jgi:hypothetical protein
MDCTASTVTRELVMDIVTPDDQREQVDVLLRYDTADPYAVCAEFRTGAGQQVRWYLARELMSDGLTDPTGHGDVRIWPAWCGSTDIVNISLMSHDGHAVVQAAARDVVDFLGSSYALCPPGTESQYLDVDAGLRSLLAH